MVRPHLDFAVQAWCPYLVKDIAAIEKIQKKATKMVPGLKKIPYEKRIEFLGFDNLSKRRIRGDLIQMYKIFHNIEEINFIKPINYLANKVTEGKLRAPIHKLHEEIVHN